MAKKEMKKTLMVLSLTLISIVALAQQDKYKVLFCNSDGIMIGNRVAKKGLLFNGDDTIFMPNEECALDVRNETDGTTKRIVGEKLNKYKTKTLYSYFVEERRLSTKGMGADDRIVYDTVYYMLEDVKIPAPSQHTSGIEYRGIVYMGKELKAITVSRSKDSMEYVISRDALGKQHKKPFYLDIIEKDVEKDWEYAVWRELYVVPLPLKIE